MLLHERLKDLRINTFSNPKTQQDICDLFKIARSLYSLIESGKRFPTYKQLETAIRYYDVDKKTELEMRKQWFLLRLPDDVYECHQSINELVQSQMTQIEIKNYVEDKKIDKQQILNEPVFTKLISYLQNLDEERRAQDLETFTQLLKLPMKESVGFKKICNLAIKQNEDILDKIYTIVKTII